MKQQTFLFLFLVFLGGCVTPPAPKPYGPTPTVEQMKYYNEELSAFFHFGVNTYTENTEWGNGKEDPNIFNPSQLDCNQWIDVIQKAGFKRAIITLKHHDGFNLYPTKWSNHSVISSSWKNGKGDVMKAFSDACTRYDMGVGVYLSPWDCNAKCYSSDVLPDYNEMYLGQLKEILSNEAYGNRNYESGQTGRFVEVWMDGACGGNNKPKYAIRKWWDEIDRLAPGVLRLQNMGSNLRWNGSESGSSNDPNWQTLNFKYVWNLYDSEAKEDPAYIRTGEPAIKSTVDINDEKGGTIWSITEADLSIREGWFWHPGGETKSGKELAEVYFQSVGLGSPMLLNIPPNNLGLIDSSIIKSLEDFREILDSTFQTNLLKNHTSHVEASSFRANHKKYAPSNVLNDQYDSYWTLDDGNNTGFITVNFTDTLLFDVVQIQEYIPLGQRISGFEVEVEENGKWVTFGKGETIGYKRLIKGNPVKATGLRLTIEKSMAEPIINTISVFKAHVLLESSNRIPKEMVVIPDNLFSRTENCYVFENFGANGQSLCTSDPGASFKFNFTGTKVLLTGFRTDAHSEILVSIDDSIYQTVDLFPNGKEVSDIIYISPDLADKEHELNVKLLDKKNPKGYTGMHLDDAYFLKSDSKGMFELSVLSDSIVAGKDLEVKVRRPFNKVDEQSAVTLVTTPFTATHGRGYINKSQRLLFNKGEEEKTIFISTTPFEESKGCVDFFVKLTDPENAILGIQINKRITVIQ